MSFLKKWVLWKELCAGIGCVSPSSFAFVSASYFSQDSSLKELVAKIVGYDYLSGSPIFGVQESKPLENGFSIDCLAPLTPQETCTGLSLRNLGNA